ncbi:MAG: glycosyltransferase family 4 protein [Planctomycetes bacterium]|nr:glycosyltransferase family 4 protein [Planctomycetota bacterium]
MSPAGALTLCHVDAERGFSGGEAQVFLLMRGLCERGHRSILLAPPGSEASRRAVLEGFEVRELAMRSDLDLPAVLRATRILRELAPDLVHLHTSRAAWIGGLAARRAGLPAIVTRRMDRAVARNWRTRLLYGRLTHAAAAISESVARSLVEGGVDPGRVVLIPSSVDAAQWEPKRARAEVRAELGAGPETRVVLTLGALVPRKGIDVLLAALDDLSLRGIRPAVWIAGAGPASEDLARQARGLSLEGVRFLGARADAPDLLAAADVFAMPSRREGLGVAALEALAAGCPVVASRVGGLAEVVEHGESGLLVDAERPEPLARALERLLSEPELRRRFAQAGRARVARLYSASSMVARYEELYRRVLTERNSPALPPR